MDDLADLPKGWSFAYRPQPDGNILVVAKDTEGRAVSSSVIDMTLPEEEFRKTLMTEVDALARRARNRIENRKTVRLLFDNKEE